MDQPSTDRVLDSWPAHVASAVATGAATTYLPVHRWSRSARWSLHGGLGALVGVAVAATLARPATGDEPTEDLTTEPSTEPSTEPAGEPGGEVDALPPRPGPVKAVVASLVIGAAVAGVSRGSQAADQWFEDRLTARGVRRPRRWMGAAAAAASLALSVVERRGSSTGGQS
jgi:hypothetical protein